MYNYPTKLYRFNRTLLFLQNNESLNDCENFTYLTANFVLKYLASLGEKYLIFLSAPYFISVYGYVEDISELCHIQVLPSFAILSRAMFVFSHINKKNLGKVEKQFTGTVRDFVFLFLSFFFLLS